MKSWHCGAGSKTLYDAPWHIGDVIGCAVDFEEKEMNFSHNGVWNRKARIAFDEKQLEGKSLFPAISVQGMFTFLISRESWRYAAPGDDYEPWMPSRNLISGIIKRPCRGYIHRCITAGCHRMVAAPGAKCCASCGESGTPGPYDLTSDLAHEFVGKWMCHVKFWIELAADGSGLQYRDNWDKGILDYSQEDGRFEMRSKSFVLYLYILRSEDRTALVWMNPGNPPRLALKFDDWAGAWLVTKQQTDIFDHSAMFDDHLGNGSLLTEVSALTRVLCSGPPRVNPKTNIPHIPIVPEGVIWDAALDFFIPELPPAQPAEVDEISKYTSWDSIHASLLDGGTILVRGSWIVKQAADSEDGLVKLPRRQEMPAEAIWGVDEVMKAVYARQVHIWAQTYCWWTPDHPDPKGEQGAHTARILKQRLDCKLMPLDDIAVFQDWCSLYQLPRTEIEDKSFQLGLKNVNLWFAHAEITVVGMTKVPQDVLEYDKRGWPTFEKCVSSMITDSTKVLNLGSLDGDCTDWLRTSKTCRAGRLPPMAPDDFCKAVEQRVFTNANDCAFVKQKYELTFNEVMGSAKFLDFQSAGWFKDDVVQLCKALPHCPELENLKLNYNDVEKEGAIALAEVIPQCPKLKRMDLIRTRIDKEGALALAGGLAKCAAMEVVEFTDCPLEDEGVVALCKTIGKMDTMMHIFYRNTGMTDIGMRAVIDMMETSESLTQIQTLQNPKIKEDISKEARAKAKKLNVEFFTDIR